MSLRELIDPVDGENRAVRWFLACYGSGHGITVGAMKQHLTRCGFPFWPDWVGSSHSLEHLTKAGAQLWLRHLFSLEHPKDDTQVAIQQVLEVYAPHDGAESLKPYAGVPDHEIVLRWKRLREVTIKGK